MYKRQAEILCKEFPFVRVDFFVTNEIYYFAELTFTPSGGMMPFNPDKYDLEWGENMDISKELKKYVRGGDDCIIICLPNSLDINELVREAA